MPRSSAEVRINNYNPLLLLLWKANMDIQYIAECSLALAYYVTSYVTKAEKSHIQDVWNEVGEKESIYKRLWSFGIWSMRSCECGLYEASDILLGDHLFEKSQTIQWISVEEPSKRKRRLKNYSILKQLSESDPESKEVFEKI